MGILVEIMMFFVDFVGEFLLNFVQNFIGLTEANWLGGL
jgi:hypothetical protein